MAGGGLTRGQRIELIKAIREVFSQQAWTDVDVVLTEFGFHPINLYSEMQFGDFDEECRKRLRAATDDVLQEMAAVVLETVPPFVASFAEEIDAPDLWREGYIRVFLSHLAEHRQFATDVRRDLHDFAIDGFVAHEDIEVSREWQAEIERALRSAHVFVGLVHEGFSRSWWTQQEVGWALGRGLPVFMIRLGEIPGGFPAKWQWPSMVDKDADLVATAIAKWITSNTQLSDLMVPGLIDVLRNAGNYFAAEAAAKRIEAVGKLTHDQLELLNEAFLANNQVHSSVLAYPVVERILTAHGRSMPKRSK